MEPDAVVEALAAPALLRHAAGLSLPASRREAARALAAAVGVEAIVIFIRDKEVDALLPAAGFPQTLPDGAAWRTFLAGCVRHGRADASLPIRAGEYRPSVGHAWERDAVLVLVGTSADSADVTWLRALLPLLHATFRAEGVETLARAQATLAHESAARAATLATMLDKARTQVESALAIARAARVELEEKNTLLQDHAVEMEMVNQQLLEQAHAMETQAIEMELQADELLSANAALQHTRRLAEAANRAKSDFLATMSHELRTPLNAIAGHTQLLTMGLRGPLNDEQRDALDRIDRSQRHLLGLINDILNLSRIEAGRMHYELVAVSLADALAEVAPMIEPQIAAKQLALDVADLTHLPPVCVDREKLQQILLNLLSNAVKFTEAGGRVCVEAVEHAHDAGSVLVTVSDTGRGIPADKLDFIFEPFTQVDASHSRLGQGTGLGLAISRDLARGMGGDLTVRSELGAGSTFTLSLIAGSPPGATKTGGE